jgi:hypothetical protein
VQKADNGAMPPVKMQRTDEGDAAVVPMPHVQQPDVVAHSQGGFQQPTLMQLQQPYPANTLVHAIPAPTAPQNADQMHVAGIPEPVPGPYVPLHPHDGSAAAEQMPNPAHMALHVSPVVDPPVSAAQGVPPPSEAATMYAVPPPQEVHTSNGAPVGHAVAGNTALPPGPYQHQPQVDASGQVQQPGQVQQVQHHAVHDGSGQQQEMVAMTCVVPSGSGNGKVEEQQMYIDGSEISTCVVPEVMVPGVPQLGK